MSDHRTHEARFGALLDGDLEAEPRAEVEAHLADCAQCAAAWQRYAASVAALRLDPAPPTPSTHVAAVMARVADLRSSTASARQATSAARSTDGDVVTTAAPIGARRQATARWRTLATHVAALAAGALAMIALAPLFGAREATSITEQKRSAAGTGLPTDDSTAVARASEHEAAARRDSNRAAAAALALQQVALARALVERDAAQSLAAAELARTRAAEAQLADTQLADAQRNAAERAERELAELELQRDARRREDERLAAATQRAGARRAAAEAFAAVALVRSFERLGATLAQLDAELVARADTTRSTEAAPTRATEPTHPAAPTARDWRAIDVDAASLAATGRRAEHVTIRRDGDRVALSTTGTVDDIVAALLVRLDDPDPAVRAAVELRLDDIAAELGVARADAARPGKSADEPWWRSDRGQVAALTIGDAGDTREPWPAWWSRARSAVGR